MMGSTLHSLIVRGMAGGGSSQRSVFFTILMLLICYLQVKFVVMDEFSMVSSNQLYQICRKLQVVNFIYWIMLWSHCESPKELMQRNGVPFGGVSVILLGDALQLKPVSYINSKASLVITGQTYLIQVIGHFTWMAPTVEEHEIRHNITGLY